MFVGKKIQKYQREAKMVEFDNVNYLEFPQSFARAAILDEIDKRIFDEFFVTSSNMADMTFVILLSWEWLIIDCKPRIEANPVEIRLLYAWQRSFTENSKMEYTRIKNSLLLLYAHALGIKKWEHGWQICSISFVFFLSRRSFFKFLRRYTNKQITNETCWNIAIFTTHVLTF